MVHESGWCMNPSFRLDGFPRLKVCKRGEATRIGLRARSRSCSTQIGSIAFAFVERNLPLLILISTAVPQNTPEPISGLTNVSPERPDYGFLLASDVARNAVTDCSAILGLLHLFAHQPPSTLLSVAGLAPTEGLIRCYVAGPVPAKQRAPSPLTPRQHSA